MSMRINDNSIRNLLARSNNTIATHAHTDQCCPISLDPIELGDRLVILECSHIFLEDNINEWLSKNHTCPLCRHDLRPTRPIINNNSYNINNNNDNDDDDNDYIDIINYSVPNDIHWHWNRISNNPNITMDIINNYPQNIPTNQYDTIIG